MTSSTKQVEVVTDLSPFVRVYNDGTVERLLGSPYAPTSLEDPITGVSSKDITISPEVSARLFLPQLTLTAISQKLPILIYFHGGAFCIQSAFTLFEDNYLKTIVSHAKALAISVEYRLAPEHPLPAAYQDCWTALQYVASHSIAHDADQSFEKEPWIINHADFDRLYVGGDSAGGNIVHNMAMRVGVEKLNGGVKILGGFLSHPYFWGSEPIGSEPSENHEQSLPYRVWLFAYPSAPGGINSPMINPFKDDGPSLAGLGCSRLLVSVAEKDQLMNRGVKYVGAVRESGWKGTVELVEVEGEDHCFHMLNPDTERAKTMTKRLASFIV